MLIRRDIPGLDQHWLFPGGKIEVGETVFQAASREVMEETGVFCRPVRIISTRTHPANGLKFAYVICEYVSQASNPRREYRVRWFKANHVPKLMRYGVTKSVAAAVGDLRRAGGVRSFRRGANEQRLPLLSEGAPRSTAAGR